MGYVCQALYFAQWVYYDQNALFFFQKALSLSGTKFGIRPAPSTKGVSTAVHR